MQHLVLECTCPSEGLPRNVAAPVIDMLYPPGNQPNSIIAVTGTNGKTTTTRLLAHIKKQWL
jgi:cyanophycin synthetase